MNVGWGIRTAAILCWAAGLGFGLPCLPTAVRLLQGRGLPMFMGFHAYGGGPFERAGVPTMVTCLIVFLIFCIFDCAAGWLLWGGHRTGGVLALALLPIGAIFWWGFALPLPPLAAIVRTALILVYWKTLS